MAYKVILLHLDTASNDKQPVVAPGSRITEVALLTLPAGVSIKLALGDNEPFTVDKPITLQPVGDDLSNRGLYLVNQVARPGVTLELLVAFGDTRAGAAA